MTQKQETHIPENVILLYSKMSMEGNLKKQNISWSCVVVTWRFKHQWFPQTKYPSFYVKSTSLKTSKQTNKQHHKKTETSLIDWHDRYVIYQAYFCHHQTWNEKVLHNLFQKKYSVLYYSERLKKCAQELINWLIAQFKLLTSSKCVRYRKGWHLFSVLWWLLWMPLPKVPNHITPRAAAASPNCGGLSVGSQVCAIEMQWCHYSVELELMSLGKSENISYSQVFNSFLKIGF